MSIDTTKYTAHKGPGKFEGETAATEYFWEQSLNGDGDTIYSGEASDEELDYCPTDSATIFTIMSEEADAFGLHVGNKFMVREDSQGFVYGSVHPSRKNAEAKFRDWLGISS